MKKDLYYITVVVAIPSFIVMFFLFASKNYQISFGIEQDNNSVKTTSMGSLVNK